MTKTVPFQANRAKGEVALPEAGEGAYLQFDVESLELLEDGFGEDYIDTIIKDLSKMRVKTYQKVVAATLKGSSNGELPYGLRWEDLNIRILDALHLAIHGRTFEEQQQFNLDQMTKRMGALEENPQLAAALSLMSAGKQESEQG